MVRNSTKRDVPDAMPVRSMRLPADLWQRLEAALAEVNASRHGRRSRMVTMSSLLRALLERALDDPGESLQFDRLLYRPPRVQVEKARQRMTASLDPQSLFRALDEASQKHNIRPLDFARGVGGDPLAAQDFFLNARTPQQDPTGFLMRVKAFLDNL